MTTLTAAPSPSPRIAALRASLAASRVALLAAIGTLAERDFASALPSGSTVVATLAVLAPLERDAVHAARAAIGAPTRPRLGGGEAPAGRALPPQVVHDLAGARYETALFLDSLQAAELDSLAGDGTIEALLAAVAAREQATAEQVSGRPRAASATSA